MKTREFSRLASVLALSVAAALPLDTTAGKPGGTSTATALKAYVYSSYVDEQDTIAFSPDPYACPGLDLGPETAQFRPDSAAGTFPTWDRDDSIWDNLSLPGALYEDGKDCASTGSCLRAQFISSDRVLTIDTNTTRTAAGVPRKLVLDFSVGFNPSNDTTFAVTNSPLGGPVVQESTPGLFEVLGAKSSLKNMKVCTSRECMEATQNTYARFWFTNPYKPDETWRLNWNFTRVLRVSLDTWYFIAGACDGSQTAGLSKLAGSNTKPREINMGWFEMPFFIAVTLK